MTTLALYAKTGTHPDEMSEYHMDEGQHQCRGGYFGNIRGKSLRSEIMQISLVLNSCDTGLPCHLLDSH